jgi:hypothetical protein
VYCLGGIQWGAYRDANAKKDKYWYWGMLRSYVTYIFMGLKSEESGVSWQCKGHLSYIVPCKGCSRCVRAVESDKSGHRWWHVFISRQPTEPGSTCHNYHHPLMFLSWTTPCPFVCILTSVPQLHLFPLLYCWFHIFTCFILSFSPCLLSSKFIFPLRLFLLSLMYNMTILL